MQEERCPHLAAVHTDNYRHKCAAELQLHGDADNMSAATPSLSHTHLHILQCCVRRSKNISKTAASSIIQLYTKSNISSTRAAS